MLFMYGDQRVSLAMKFLKISACSKIVAYGHGVTGELVFSSNCRNMTLIIVCIAQFTMKGFISFKTNMSVNAIGAQVSARFLTLLEFC